jgi:tetratricopeptide (TPR) repeat protein
MKYEVVIFALFALLVSVAPAAEPVSADALVKQLGAAQFSLRQEAAAKLRAMGPAAIAALERAVKSDDPEVALAAAEILKDARLGIGPDWPAELAEQVRGCDELDVAARTVLIRRALAELKERALPFLLARTASGDPAEANCVLDCLRAADREDYAAAIVKQAREPQNDREAKVLGWAYMKLNRPLDALRVLTTQNADEATVRELTEKAVKKMLRMLADLELNELTEMAAAFAKANPTEARFLYLQAEALQAQGNGREAEPLRAKALELQPDQEAPHYTAGEMLLDLGRNELSLKEWQAILKIPPENDVYDINAYLRLGRIYQRLKKNDLAADNYEKALEIFKTKRAGGNSGYGMIGGNEADLARIIAELRGKGGAGGIAVGKPGEQIRVRVKAALKAGKPEELAKAIKKADCSLAVNVQPFGFRLLDLDQCTLSYDRERQELNCLLNNSPACQPIGIEFENDNIPDRFTALVSSLDCFYVIEIDTQTGQARRTGRFEMDYTLKLEPDEALKDYRSAPVKIGEREYAWDELRKGVTVDYLPPMLELQIEGQQPDGTPRKLDFKIKLKMDKFWKENDS